MKKLALFALLACASVSFAQPAPAGWIQPWTPPLPAWESRVISCPNPNTPSVIALDDFSVNNAAGLQLTTINWWGTVSLPAQINRNYYIAIYKDMGCMPDKNAILFKTCIRPQAQPVGGDCTGQQVYKFFTNYPAGTLTLGPGQYWIQISEADQGSVQPGIPDFWWSSHDPIVQCPAMQMDAFGNIFRPLIEPCFQRKVDLAFEIF